MRFRLGPRARRHHHRAHRRGPNITRMLAWVVLIAIACAFALRLLGVIS